MQELLNFLPSDQKHELARMFSLRIAARALALILVIVTFYTAAMFGIYFTILQDIDIVKQKQNDTRVILNGTQDISLEEAIIDLNNRTKRLQDIQTTYIVWSYSLQKIEEIIVPGIHLDHISLNAENKTANVGGTADVRDNYFAFQSAMDVCDCITSVKLPLSLLKTDIQFRVDMQLSDSFFSDEK